MRSTLWCTWSPDGCPHSLAEHADWTDVPSAGRPCALPGRLPAESAGTGGARACVLGHVHYSRPATFAPAQCRPGQKGCFKVRWVLGCKGNHSLLNCLYIAKHLIFEYRIVWSGCHWCFTPLGPRLSVCSGSMCVKVACSFHAPPTVKKMYYGELELSNCQEVWIRVLSSFEGEWLMNIVKFLYSMFFFLIKKTFQLWDNSFLGEN